MKLDYRTSFQDIVSNTPFLDNKQQPLLLGTAIILACSTALPGDEQLSAVDKFKIGEIAICVHKGLDITSEQISTAKERGAKAFNSPVLIYLFHQALETPASVSNIDPAKDKAAGKVASRLDLT